MTGIEPAQEVRLPIAIITTRKSDDMRRESTAHWEYKLKSEIGTNWIVVLVKIGY
jgi:hypothetical protein